MSIPYQIGASNPRMVARPDENLETIRRVLGDDYLELEIKNLTYADDFLTEKSNAKLDMVTKDGSEMMLEGEGVGLIDAVMKGLMNRFASEYQSLTTIEISGFSVRADIDTKNQKAGSDAVGVVSLDVVNSDGRTFRFADSSRSVVASAAKAVLAAVEYFVNAERAFIVLHKALEDAKSRNRNDLASRYTRELTEVAESTSYAEVIDRIRKQLP